MKNFTHIFDNTRDELFNNIFNSISSKENIIETIYKSEEEGKRINEIFVTNNKLPSVDDIILKYEESDYPRIGIALINENRLDDCLELTSEIYSSEYIWENEVYKSYFEPICKNAIKNNNLDFLDNLKLTANQWFECKNYMYSLTVNEMLAHQLPLIMDTFIKLSIINKKNSKQIVLKAQHFFDLKIKIFEEVFTDLLFSTCLSISRSFLNAGYTEISKKIMNRFHDRYIVKNHKLDSLTFNGAFNYLILKDIEEDSQIIEFADRISTMKIIKDEFGFIFHWSNLNEAVEANIIENLTPLFMHANSGQSGIGPFLLKEKNDSLSRSSLFNLLFFKYCKIDEYQTGREYLNQSINLIKEIDDIDSKSRGYYLILTVLADALNCKFSNKNYYSLIFNDAIYYASLVRDYLPDYSCFCKKYSGQRYKGICCDICGKTVSNNGYKKLAFDYLFENLNKNNNDLNLTNNSVKNILGKFNNDIEKSSIICDLLGVTSSKNYKFYDSIQNIIKILIITTEEDKVGVRCLSLLKNTEENTSENILLISLIETNLKKIQLVIPKILEAYIRMLRNYHSLENMDEFNKCISHYLSFLNFLNGKKASSYAYLSLLKLLVEINLIDQYINLLPKIIFKNDLDNFSNSYVDRFDFKQSILFSTKTNRDVKDSISLALSNDFKKLKNWQNERYIYLSHFYYSPNSLLNYLKHELKYMHHTNNEQSKSIINGINNLNEKI